VGAGLVLVAAAAGLAVSAGDDTTDTPTPATTAPGPTVRTTDVPERPTTGSATTGTAVPGTTATTTAGSPASPTPTAPSGTVASVALEPFLAAASTMDGQLRDAARAINAAGPPWGVVGDDVAGLVRAAAPGPVADAIPAGLPPDLLRPVVLVYSDLMSRRSAMSGFTLTSDAIDDALALEELGNGHEAAQAFDDDLAAVRRTAAGTTFTVAPGDSRAAAEVLLLVQYADKANGGCDSRGGVRLTELPAITWQGPDRGTIGGIGFTATLASGRWTVQIAAC
jgi:hypothetical protein